MSGSLGPRQLSSIFIAWTMLVRMRPIERASTPISSREVRLNSGNLELAQAHAVGELRQLGHRPDHQHHSIRLSTMPITANTTPVEVMNSLKAWLARSSGTCVGTEMICAPTTSLSCQPKPLAGP